METKLVQAKNGEDFKLCNEMGVPLVNFVVEINKETALISYDTLECFKNQGYASKGLILLRDTLFSKDSILFLELINLSGNYSRRVAENAGFFGRNNDLNYYICLNPHAEQIINDKLSLLDISSVKYKKTQMLFKKVQTLRHLEKRKKQKAKEKLGELLTIRESEDYKKYYMENMYGQYIDTEINHLQKIVADSYDAKKL